jgi:regulator of RNase E activity RraA
MGDTTVMPGDIAIGDPEGVTFVPAQLAEKVADDTEMDHMIDEWGHTMLRERKYTPGQIDAKWTPQMIREFNAWLKAKGSKLHMAE